MSEKNNKENKSIKDDTAANTDENMFSDASFSGFGSEDDDFDKKYRRAVARTDIPANRLLNDLSRESKADRYNFMGAFIPIILIIILSLSFVFISRGDIEELFDVKFSAQTIIDGSYLRSLNTVYESTLPFSDGIKTLGAMLGFCEKPIQPNGLPSETPEADSLPEQNQPADPAPLPANTLDLTVSEPEVTTTPAATEEATPATTEETEPEVYDTYTMYASATLNVRFGPSTEDAILGYYNQNDPVEVIEIMDNGWASVLFDGHKAFAHGDYLSKKKVEVTTKKKRTEATATEETESAEQPEDDTDITTAIDDETITVPEADTDISAENDGFAPDAED